METGDPSLLEALDCLWCNLTEKKMYIHGGVCPLYRGFAFRNGRVWGADDVWEAAGMDYQLPNAYGYNETCGQIGNFMWNYRMLLITAEARYADVMETEMLNGFLGSMGLDGKSFFYVNPLRWHGDEQVLMSNSSLERGIPGTPNIGTCCPTNYSRSLVELQGMLYSRSDKAFWIHHYGANQYDDGSIALEQVTRYPWAGRVEITVRKLPEAYALRARVPGWAEGTRAAVNGVPVERVLAGEYLSIERAWRPGDTVILEFPMKPRLIMGNPKIEETRGQVAVMRGPLVYALEEIDLSGGVTMDGVVIPFDTDFQAVDDPNLLGGVTLLQGTAKHLPQPDWDGKLYRDLPQPGMREFMLKLIPYYVWANRGVCQMTVWIPIDY